MYYCNKLKKTYCYGDNSTHADDMKKDSSSFWNSFCCKTLRLSWCRKSFWCTIYSVIGVMVFYEAYHQFNLLFTKGLDDYGVQMLKPLTTDLVGGSRARCLVTTAADKVMKEAPVHTLITKKELEGPFGISVTNPFEQIVDQVEQFTGNEKDNSWARWGTKKAVNAAQHTLRQPFNAAKHRACDYESFELENKGIDFFKGALGIDDEKLGLSRGLDAASSVVHTAGTLNRLKNIAVDRVNSFLPKVSEPKNSDFRVTMLKEMREDWKERGHSLDDFTEAKMLDIWDKEMQGNDLP